MLFLAGLESMPRKEMVDLIAQLNAITPSRALSENAQKMASSIKDWTLRVGARIAAIFSAPLSSRIVSLQKESDWDPNVIRRATEEEAARLSQRDERDLKAELRRHLFELAKAEPGTDDKTVARAIILRAAQSLKVPNAEYYPDPEALENAFLKAWIQQLLQQLQELSVTRTEELEEQLRTELQKLSKAQSEAVRKALGVDELSAAVVISVLKSGGGALAAQALVGSFGFGAFLFLATALKAVGLLFGTTFAFGTYAAASSSLAFLLSPPFLLLLVGLTGAVVLVRASTQLDGYKAQLLVVVGRSQLLAASQKKRWRRWLDTILHWISLAWQRFQAKTKGY